MTTKNLKTVSRKPSFQGDVMLRLVDSIPKGFEIDSSKEAAIIAHSETGHHHTIHDMDEDVMVQDHHGGVETKANIKVFRSKSDPFNAYIEVVAPAKVVHHRTSHTHDTLGLPAGIYHVRRQREYSPFGERMAQD